VVPASVVEPFVEEVHLVPYLLQLAFVEPSVPSVVEDLPSVAVAAAYALAS
jgi:hypothetical protein